MLAEGQIERETDHSEVPITHLICRKLTDRSDLLRTLTQEEGPMAGHLAAPPKPSDTHAKAGLPPSRDFR
jgi:hypothetical protein